MKLEELDTSAWDIDIRQLIKEYMITLNPKFWGIFIERYSTEQEWRSVFVRKLRGDVMDAEINLMTNND